MIFRTMRICCVLSVLIMALPFQGFGQGNNPSGMGTYDPRQPSQAPEQGSSRTTADVLRDAGLTAAPPGSEPSVGRKGFDNALWPGQDLSLFLAAGGGSLEEIVTLLRAGAQVNYRDGSSGMTPLMTVRTQAQAAVLLAAGADVSMADRQGKTALHHALFADEAEGIVNLLLACGADANAAASGQGHETPVLAARQLFFEGGNASLAGRIMRTLVYAGGDPDAQDHMGYTALITAAVNNKPGLARLMVDLGANVHVRTPDGMTALAWARRLGSADVERVLLQAGARQ